MLFENFITFKKSEFLVGVTCEFGKININQPMQTPSIIWFPIDEEILPPQFLEERVIIDGKQYQKTEICRRKSNVNVYVFEKNYEQLEALINKVSNALFETGNYTWQNLYPNSGEFLDRESISDNTVGYVYKMSVIIPQYNLTLQHALQSQTLTVTPK